MEGTKKHNINMVWYFLPVSNTKNLAQAYNDYAAKIHNPDDWLVFQDRDVMYLTHDYFEIIEETIKANPQYSMFTCLTNRVGNLQQCYGGEISENADMLFHEEIASRLAREKRTDVENSIKVISGMVMIIQKKTWDLIGGAGSRGLLGVDNFISRKVLNLGKKIGIMQGLYVLHYYRLRNGVRDKSHLKTA